MRHSSFALPVLLLASLLLSCGKKAGEEPGGGGGAAPGGPPAAAPARKLTPEQLQGLAGIDIDGFERRSGQVAHGKAQVVYQSREANASGVKASVWLAVGPCSLCFEMELAEWRARADNLKRDLPRVHIDNPALVFDIDEREVAGKKLVTIYSLSFVEQERSDGRKNPLSSHRLVAFHHDGVNEITLRISGRATRSPSSLEELRTRFTKEEMLAALDAVLSKFAGAF